MHHICWHWLPLTCFPSGKDGLFCHDSKAASINSYQFISCADSKVVPQDVLKCEAKKTKKTNPRVSKWSFCDFDHTLQTNGDQMWQLGAFYFRSCSINFLLLRMNYPFLFNIDGWKNWDDEVILWSHSNIDDANFPAFVCIILPVSMFKWLTLPHFRTIYLKYDTRPKGLSCKTLLKTVFGQHFWYFCISSSIFTPTNCVWTQSLCVLHLVSFCSQQPSLLHFTHSATWWIYQRQSWRLFSWQIVECSVGAHSRAPGAFLWIHLSLCLPQICCNTGSTAQQCLEIGNKWLLWLVSAIMLM